jgi:hypothetical protein
MERTGFFRVDYVTFMKKIMISKLAQNGSISDNNSIDTNSTFCRDLSTLLRKKLPEMLISSHRTTTIF